MVGLFVDPTPDDVRAVLAAVPLDLLQFHGREPAELCRAFGRPYLKAIPVAQGATGVGLLEYAARYADAAGLLFDAPPAGGLPGGTGQTLRLGCAAAAAAAAAGAVRGPQRRQRRRRDAPRAAVGRRRVAAASRCRTPTGSPVKGCKDPARIEAFIEEVRNADGGSP